MAACKAFVLLLFFCCGARIQTMVFAGRSLFSFVLSSFLLLNSCKNAIINQEPVNEYFEYWSETVTIGRYEVDSPYEKLRGVKNLAANNPIEIEVLITNPKRYNLGLNDGAGNANFQILNQADEDVATEKRASLSDDKSVIMLNARLDDDTEKESLRLRGNFEILKGEDQISFETIAYSYDFVQNTPPDRPRNLRNSESPDAATGYHHVYFDFPEEVPHQTKKRHENLVYEVSCYLNEGGSYSFVASATLTKNDSLSSSGFSYYFPEQLPSLRYDYTVTFRNPVGLTTETVSTVPGIGVCYVTDPELSFGDNGEFNGLTAQRRGHSYDVIEYSGNTLTFTAQNTTDGASMEVDINGTKTTGNTQTLTIANDSNMEGFRDIKVTVSKNLCKPVVMTKRVYVVPKLTDPVFSSSNGSVSGNTLTYSYLNYDNGKLNVMDSYRGVGSSMTITIDGEEQTPGNISSKELTDGEHTVSWSITKDHCITLNSSETMTVKIKPVTVRFSGNGFTFHGADNESGDTIDLCGSIHAGTDDTSGVTIKSWWDDTVSKSAFWVPIDSNTKFIMKTRGCKFYFWAEDMADKDGSNLHSIGSLPFGSASSTRTLENFKNGSKNFNGVGGSGEGYFNCTFTLVLSEE